MVIFFFNLLWILSGAQARGATSGAVWPPLAGAVIPSALLPDSAVCLAPESGLGGNLSAPARPVVGQASWVRGGVCHRLKREDYCAYTNPSFNGGEGVSLITTYDQLDNLASEPIFDEAADVLSVQKPSVIPPYHEVEIPGKGIGIVATRVIRTGQRIMARTPAVMIDARALGELKTEKMAQLVGIAIENLPESHRDRYLNLAIHDVVKSDAEKAYKVFTTNAYRTRLSDEAPEFHSTFTEISRINHDCKPNCAYHFDPATLSHKVYASTDIFPGEEITVSYIDPIQSRAARQHHLHKHWGFNCNCDRCSAEAHLLAESEDRISQIYQLWKDLDDYTSSSQATPEKAELLISLFELEGVGGRMHEAYYRAAIEWNGIGEDIQAIRYARMCLDRGLTLKGPNRPFQESMRKLIKAPKKHWSWRFRLEEADLVVGDAF